MTLKDLRQGSVSRDNLQGLSANSNRPDGSGHWKSSGHFDAELISFCCVFGEFQHYKTGLPGERLT
jgi:hypothetical protein